MSYNSTYDLFGKKVSDTYPSLLQSGSDGVFYDGRGESVTINATIPNIYVKYSETGSFATTGSNTFIGNQIITGSIYLDAPGTDSIYFSGSGPAGRLVWNDVDGTLDLGLKGDNVTLQIGQESVIQVINKTGANLLESEYKAVRIRRVDEGGAQGQRLAIVLAQANNDANSADTLGLVTEDIDTNQEGFITNSGLVRNINTTGNLQGETWVDGDVLYLSPTTPGALTKVKPQAPQHTVIIGYVVYTNANNGKIFVKVDNGYEIDELHNVRITTASLTAGQLLVRSGSSDSGVWINSNQLTGSYGLTGSLQATSFTGSLLGTASQAENAVTASYVLNAVSSSFSATASYITPNNALIAGLPYTVYTNTTALTVPANTNVNTVATITIPSSSIRVGSMIRVNSLSSIGTIAIASPQSLTTQSAFIDTAGFFYDSAIRQSTLYPNIIIKVTSTTTLKSFPTIRTVFQGPTTTAIITKTIPDITTNDINLYMNVQKGGAAYAFSQEILNVEVIY